MIQFTRLRVVGFKSFVESSELLIEPGLTGVVGPNGCGKSNVVEALRWVMGETSAKQLRGGEMDDVIFGGTSNRPARNVAEVTVSLDNRSRTAPAMFNNSEELEVTRRITRGGGSVYRVNGKDVRARDVQLLFADAATGARSTAMVSQGRVGALINAKPSQRRALLEEAAGIGGLYSRRHEAELRLRAAEGNLSRLEDVLVALDGQLGGLKRQSKQASRYRELSNRVRLTEAQLLRQRWLTAIRALEEARRAFEEAERLVGDRAALSAQITREQAEAAAAVAPMRDAEAEAAARVQRLAVAREQLEAEDRQLAQTREENRTRLAQAKADMDRVREQAKDAVDAIARLDAERESLEADQDGEEAAKEDAQEALYLATEATNTLESELTKATEVLAALQASRAAQERAVREAEERARRLEQRLLDLERQREAAQGTAVAPEDLELAEAAEMEAEAALADSRADLEAGELARAESQAARDLAEEARRAAEGEATRLSAEARGLEATLTRAAPKGDWPPVLDALTVREGGEKALAGALGDDLLASLDSGAPSRWKALPPLPVTPQLPEGAQPLSDLVEAPPALARRLSQVGLVGDGALADSLMEKLAPGQRLVDSEGALWRWDGLYRRAGAQDTAGAAAVRLETRNRLESLREEIAEAEERSLVAQEAAEAARAAGLQAAEGERRAREAARIAERSLSQARDHRARLEREAAAAESRLVSLEQSLEQARVDWDEVGERLAESRLALEEMGDGLDLREQVAQLKGDLADRRGVLVEARSAYDRIAREAEDRLRRLSTIGEEVASWGIRRDRAADQEAELAERAEAALDELEAIEGRPEEIAEKRAFLVDEIALAEEGRRTAADALVQAERRLSEADRTLREAEKAEAQTRESRVRMEGAVEQCRTTCRTVAESIAEKLDCTPEKLPEVAGLEDDSTLPPIDEAEARLTRLVRERDAMGPVNLRAEQETRELEEQISGLCLERDDLTAAIARLRQGINELNREGRARLLESFKKVDQHFQVLFSRLFGGGKAHLTLIESDDPLEAGLEIMASPPGKRLQSLGLLSGGEQALTATALLFAVFLTNPAPICVLDEVDAPLDDANVDRFCGMLRDLTDISKTRFLVVTHHRMTMARMDRLFGVTMAERGVSTLVSVDLRQAEELRDGDGATV
ncbi:chromosome segregation protein SMC [Rhodospirillum sp. A1_3_36]|uniref:chromosome segregation protein SMC n=1 Tax=Rhodospirillum sp. A1_3_36 TaxID=3391666 RepID=UPI0039A5C373